MEDADEEAEDGSGAETNSWSWLGKVTAIATLASTCTGLVVALQKAFAHDEAKPSTDKAAADTQGPAQERPLMLIWGPADCTGDPTPSVGVSSCGDRRGLDWLAFQMDGLRRSDQLGFGALPKGFKLQAADYVGKPNYQLFVLDQEGKRRFSVGVGYNRNSKSKDGALRIYLDGHVVGEAWLRPDGSWIASKPGG